MSGFMCKQARRLVTTTQSGLRTYSLGILTVLALCIPAAAQESGADSPQAAAMEQFRADLALERVHLREDIATLRRFSDWLDHLINIAPDDPGEALNQRLPMAACRASVLEHACDEIITLFAPDSGLTPSRHFSMRYSDRPRATCTGC